MPSWSTRAVISPRCVSVFVVMVPRAIEQCTLTHGFACVVRGPQQARKVYDTALTLQFGLPASARTDAPLLFRHYAEMEFYRPEALAQERASSGAASVGTSSTSSAPSRAEIDVANSVTLHVVLSAMEESYSSPHPPAPRTKRKKKGAAPAPPPPEQPIAIAPTRVLKARNVCPCATTAQRELCDGRDLT
jgi:hypothetical protein